MHAVVLSHPHLDHYELADQLDPAVPIYLGAEAERVMHAAAFFSPMSFTPRLAGYSRAKNLPSLDHDQVGWRCSLLATL
jgi:glyoxylase-like metal-dependent hydrolase (beta-lactamase superfamily II)